MIISCCFSQLFTKKGEKNYVREMPHLSVSVLPPLSSQVPNGSAVEPFLGYE